MPTPFWDPRTGQLYFRRGIPEPLRAAFDGKARYKVSLRTKDPVAAKVGLARENAAFEAKLADAKCLLAEGTLVLTPGALVQRWCEGTGLAGLQRLVMTLMEMDTPAGGRATATPQQIYPPAILGPDSNTDWNAVLSDKAVFDAVVSDSYRGEIEEAGTNWIRLRWHNPEDTGRPILRTAAQRLRGLDPAAEQFSGDELADALLRVVDEKRSGDEEINRARLARRHHRPSQPRLRQTLRLKPLFDEWKASTQPRPQTALEFEAEPRRVCRRLQL